jgi:hypothetical protein
MGRPSRICIFCPGTTIARSGALRRSPINDRGTAKLRLELDGHGSPVPNCVKYVRGLALFVMTNAQEVNGVAVRYARGLAPSIAPRPALPHLRFTEARW